MYRDPTTAAFTHPVVVGPDSVAVHASVGIATNHKRTVAAEDLIRDADVAMYKAKTSGKGHFQVFHPSMGAAVLERQGLQVTHEPCTASGLSNALLVARRHETAEMEAPP